MYKNPGGGWLPASAWSHDSWALLGDSLDHFLMTAAWLLWLQVSHPRRREGQGRVTQSVSHQENKLSRSPFVVNVAGCTWSRGHPWSGDGALGGKRGVCQAPGTPWHSRSVLILQGFVSVPCCPRAAPWGPQ